MRDWNTINVDMTMSEHDNMLGLAGVAAYASAGKSAIHCIDLAAEIAGEKRFGRILDFACGYGRVLRYMAACFPWAELTACDIVPQGVEFCTKAFGAKGVVSHRDIGKIVLEDRYDLIWVGSLLTHVDEKQAKVLLGLFLQHLAPDGILIVSFHGRLIPALQYTTPTRYIDFGRFGKIQARYQAEGYGFAAYDGSPGYGVSLTALAWPMQWLQPRQELTLLYYAEKLFDGHQDVLALQNRPVTEHSTVKIRYAPAGPAEQARSEISRRARMYIDYIDEPWAGKFALFGWAVLPGNDAAGSRKQVVLRRGGREHVFAAGTLLRHDVTLALQGANYDESGWQAFIDTAGMAPGRYKVGIRLSINGQTVDAVSSNTILVHRRKTHRLRHSNARFSLFQRSV